MDLRWLLAAVSLTVSGLASANSVNDEPITDNWAPSEWGIDDMAGAVNRTTPAIILDALKYVKQGKVTTLGKVYQEDAPAFGARTWKLKISALPSGGPFGPQNLVYNEEYISTEIGQIGTQFDGPGHIVVITSKGTYYYNGHYQAEPEINSKGMGPLGVEHVAKKGFVCRGVLLDAVAFRGSRLKIPKSHDASDPRIVTDEDIKAIVKFQGIDPIGEGDCVFLYTGHGDIWHPTQWDYYDAEKKAQRIAKFNAGSPGYGISGCE
jgi:hypothetical protein